MLLKGKTKILAKKRGGSKPKDITQQLPSVLIHIRGEVNS